MGTLFWAPLGTPPDGDWIEIGTTVDDVIYSTAGDEPFLPRDPRDFFGRSVTSSMPLRDFPATAYRLLFRRRHPKISAMHRAYRRKSRNR